jgi:DNA-binding CsgD family transcriptional regulator
VRRPVVDHALTDLITLWTHVEQARCKRLTALDCDGEMNGTRTPQPPRPDGFGLTRRELKIANLFAYGMSLELIGLCMSVNSRAIPVHLVHVYRKMAGSADASFPLTATHRRKMRDWLIERELLVDRSKPEALLARAIAAVESVPPLPRWVPRREREMLTKELADDKAELKGALKALREVSYD